MKSLMVIGVLICAGIVAAEETLVLRPGYTLPVSVYFDKRVEPGAFPSLQYFGGTLSCEMPPPGSETGLHCPTFGASFSLKENLESDSELEQVLHQVPEVKSEESPPNFWMEPDRRLRYRNGRLDFSVDLSSYFLSGTVIHHQWKGETAHSDLLFLVAETCGENLDCRSGLWLFSVFKDKSGKNRYMGFRPALVPLLGKIDWRKLEKDKGFGLHRVGERFAILLPVAGAGAPVVAWVASLADNNDVGVVDVRYDVYPAEWATSKEE